MAFVFVVLLPLKTYCLLKTCIGSNDNKSDSNNNKSPTRNELSRGDKQTGAISSGHYVTLFVQTTIRMPNEPI